MIPGSASYELFMYKRVWTIRLFLQWHKKQLDHLSDHQYSRQTIYHCSNLSCNQYSRQIIHHQIHLPLLLLLFCYNLQPNLWSHMYRPNHLHPQSTSIFTRGNISNNALSSDCNYIHPDRYSRPCIDFGIGMNVLHSHQYILNQKEVRNQYLKRNLKVWVKNCSKLLLLQNVFWFYEVHRERRI